MSTITTVEDLHALENGAVITANGRTYTLDGQVFRSGLFEVDMNHMEAEVRANRVTVGIRIRMGRWYYDADRERHYLCVGVHPTREGTFYLWRHRGSDFPEPGDIITMTGEGLSTAGEERPSVPNQTRYALEATAAWMSEATRQEARVSEMTAEHRTAVAQVNTTHNQWRARLNTGLLSFAEDNLNTGSDEWEAFVEVLEEHDLEAPKPATEEVEVTVEVNGETVIEFDRDDCRNRLGGAVDLGYSESVSGTVEWSYSFTVDREVDRGECACDTVDNDTVRERLDDEGVSYDDFTFEKSCPNCG